MRTIILLILAAPLHAAGPATFRKPDQPVMPLADGSILCEAEEFHVAGKGGWQAKPWGENYFVATFANSFLSRKAFLGAPEQCEKSVATITVRVPKTGKYLVLVRYESVYRFETQFRVEVEQNGKKLLDRLYGARKNTKIWAFREKLKTELAWSWGAVENIVWEGHDAAVELQEGAAQISLIADKQTGDAARRNVDCVLLTTDEKDVKERIDKENYLPLDGLLTQEGDVYLKLHNAKDGADMTLTVPNGTEHSPYWVHTRKWKPKTLTAGPGVSTDWLPVGDLLDTLNDGQWTLTPKANKAGKLRFSLELGVADAAGKIEAVAHFKDLDGPITLAYDADARYTRRFRLADQVLYDLVEYLEKQPAHGTPPKRTLIYGTTFTPRPGDAKYTAALEKFLKLTGATALNVGERESGLVRGYIDVRDRPTAKLEEYCKELKSKGLADRIAVVSLGDEIGLAPPPADDHAAFRKWLEARGLKPAEVDPAAKGWDDVKFSPDRKKTGADNPSLYWYSQLYRYRFGIKQLKERTDVLRKHLPSAGIGANFSPHHRILYMGETHHWISLFREDGMTMPWGEDYVWQVPIGSQQMNFLMLDMFRAGIKDKPMAKIHYYVMPHTPGNTVPSWRRMFYGTLGHGAKVLNLFEFRPVQAAYTENHCSDPAMFQGVRQALHELGQFEDIVQDGRVRPGQAGLWFSEAADAWDDYEHSLGAGKRSLYIAIRHQQLPLDCVLDGDDLKPYKVLYLTDRHVSRAGSKAIAEWVKVGGRLFATAGAGMFDELNQPNKVLRELLGVDETALDHAKEDVTREKEHLPFAEPLETVKLRTNATEIKFPALGARSRFKASQDAHIMADFADGSPAMVLRSEGKGHVYYCGFLPSLSYFKSAIPKRPVDRGASDDTMAHFIPTQFDRGPAMLIATPAEEVQRPVLCSEPLVETTVIEAKSGVVVPLINWSAGPVKGLTVRLTLDVPTKDVKLASGKPVKHAKEGDVHVFTLDLDAADALILR